MLNETLTFMQVGGVAPKSKINFNAVFYQVFIQYFRNALLFQAAKANLIMKSHIIYYMFQISIMKNGGVLKLKGLGKNYIKLYY